MKQFRNIGPLFTLIMLCAACTNAQAVFKTWDCTIGQWSNTSCWSPTGVPAVRDTVIVNLVPIPNTKIPTTLYVENTNAVAGNVSVDASNLSVTLQIGIGGTLDVTNRVTIGTTGDGNIVQTDGVGLLGELVLGNSDTATGTYNMSGGDLSVSTGTYVGNDGAGNFIQTGGTSSFYSLDVTELGTFNLSGSGNLTAPVEDIKGTFTQTGGTHSINNFTIGDVLDTDTGTYNMSGGDLSVSLETVVYNQFIQTGGTSNFNVLGIGDSGTFDLSGNGVLNTSDLNISGAFTQTGGTHINNFQFVLAWNSDDIGTYVLSDSGILITDIEAIGIYGIGSFTQSGGQHTVNDSLWISCWSPDGPGTSDFHLSGGSLTANFVCVARQGAFLHSGGTANFNSLVVSSSVVGENASYRLSSSASLIAEAESIGSTLGNGSFTQNGGTNTVSRLAIAASVDSAGNYTMQNGFLYADELYIGGNISSAGGIGNMSVGGTGASADVTIYSILKLWPQGTLDVLPGGTITTNTMTIESGAVVSVEFGGANPGEYGKINVTSTLNINGGSLEFALVGGYIPTIGQHFNVLDWGTLSGTFDSIIASVLPYPFDWDTSDLYNTGEIIFDTVAANGDVAPYGAPDGNINALDLLIANQIATGELSEGDLQLALGDMNNDGVIDAADVYMIQQIVLQ